ncbi:MAG: hypothetical protein J6T32_00620 [Paludibacteraceae bacterium]|nr:hypothetical protein [Paludibacteraceae bacterium]
MINILLVVLLGLVGVGLLLLELFLLPGFGIAGIGGVASLIASMALAYIWLGHTAGTITLAAETIVSLIAIIVFFRSKAINKMALDTTIDSQVGLAKPGARMEEELKEKNKQ